ncbi:ABC transporter ATP-binding protein [Azospirillum sp.]|uniref:ABC transporter ATP-binding protein n=1 Tax=Azospirillum sp. TaxID=34012 RepID=UPI002D5804F7|nr:ABC transporter ATP-binding protein [Azospirillum sp.]HYD70074.1 ABC transporter ATP-binding protein [Azospirillum sp.]
MPLLEVRELSVSIGGVRLLDGVSFAVERGDSLGVVGESGCGKSLTALALMGLLPAGATAMGSIRLDGQELLGAPERRWQAVRGRRVAMVFQEPMTALNPVRSIGAQVAEGPRLHLGLSRADAERRAVQALDRVGLPTNRFPPTLYPHQLSGGQRQRVVIATALACDPDLLIADEPTTALDVTIQAQILDLLADLAGERGMALMMITHDLGVVAETTDRMLVMYAGRVAERGPTAEVFRRMAHPYTRGLLAASPHAAAARMGEAPPGLRLPTIPGQVPDPAHRPHGCPFADRCAFVTDGCRAAPPPEIAVGPEHTAACIHPRGEPAP